MERKPQMGQAIKFVDPQNRVHDALITQPWSETCVNLVFVTKDPLKTDSYGNQLERSTSVVHKSLNNIGNYWCYADEV